MLVNYLKYGVANLRIIQSYCKFDYTSIFLINSALDMNEKYMRT